VPSEAVAPSDALQIADRRMYAHKGGSRASVTQQTRDVLLRTLRELEPDMHVHLHGVADLSMEVGQKLGTTTEQLDELARAAELHDVGKVAIPDAILNKAGPLDEAEWGFMCRHTVIAERILGAAPALRPVAKLVRASHENWDGTGYPDRLAGEEIPLGSRVVRVCDAYHAMISDRPYRTAMEPSAALEELRRCAGTHFDPAIVKAFAEVHQRDTGAPLSSSSRQARRPAAPVSTRLTPG
jgi:two-component system cell cycle response regulator